MKPRLDTKRFIGEFGGAEAVVFLLDAYGFDPPSRKGVDKWIERGKMDSNRIAQLHYIYAIEHGKRLDLTKYISFGTTDGAL